MSNSKEKRDIVDPFEAEEQAAIVAALPHQFSAEKIDRLFARIYRYMNEMPNQHPNDLIGHAETFGKTAINKDPHEVNEQGQPFVSAPSTLTIVSVLAASAVTNHEKLEGTPPDQIKPFQDVADLYTTTLLYQFDKYGYFNPDLAELVYDKESVHPGRTCTGIVEDVDGIPDGVYIEIPLVAASQKCIVREEDGTLGGGFDPRKNEATGEIKSHIQNNNIYIPSQDLYRRVREHLEETGFRRLYKRHTEYISDAELEAFLDEESEITSRIDRFLQAGQLDFVWKDWDPESRLVRVLRSAISSQEELDPGEPYPAKVLYGALEQYSPGADWEKSILRKVSSQNSLAHRLADIEDSTVEKIETEEWSANLYRVGYSRGRTRQIDFSEKEDIFELPCLQNLDDRLQEESPTRKDLYNLVRMLRWLPGYAPGEMGRNEFVVEVKDILRRYPWYDEETSDYQIRYELDKSNDEEDPYLPMNCKNPDMERYCIGREECPYSIYGSLPFPDEMYDQIDDSQSPPYR